MKIIVSFMLLGLFIGCSGDDNTVNSPAKTVIGTWDLYSSGTKLGQWVFKLSGTQKLAQLVCEYLGLYKLFRAEIAQSTMWSFAVIMVSPVLDDNAGFT